MKTPRLRMVIGDLPDPALARAVAVPLRRRVLDLVRAADLPVTVAELTEALGCNHNAVRQHLAQLREAGLVTEVLEDRSRAGRPRLLYTAALRPNPYERLARLLLEVRRTGLSPRSVGRRVGRAEASLAAEPTDALDALFLDAARHGFSPRRVVCDGRTEISLGVCPIADLAAADPATVCALHRGLAEGVLERIGGVRMNTFFANDPHEAGCRIGVRSDA